MKLYGRILFTLVSAMAAVLLWIYADTYVLQEEEATGDAVTEEQELEFYSPELTVFPEYHYPTVQQLMAMDENTDEQVTEEPEPEATETEDIFFDEEVNQNLDSETTDTIIEAPSYEEPVYDEQDYEQVFEESTSDEGWTYYGTCYITHYCNCEICCGQWAGGNTASGVYPTAYHTAAMQSLPFGTEVLINGSVYVVEDRGYYDEMWVDIYCDTHEEACNRGAYYAEVYIR